jgi:hypothetical protein
MYMYTSHQTLLYNQFPSLLKLSRKQRVIVSFGASIKVSDITSRAPREYVAGWIVLILTHYNGSDIPNTRICDIRILAPMTVRFRYRPLLDNFQRNRGRAHEKPDISNVVILA